VRRVSAPWLVIGAAIAVLITAADFVGGRGWRIIAGTLRVNPEAAATRLVSGSVVALPSLIVRTRRLAMNDLAGATPDAIVGALTRVGHLQRRWLPADAAGFVNRSREEFFRGRTRESVEALAAALTRDPSSAYLHRLQALFLFSVGDRESALSELGIAEAIAPSLRDPEIELTAEDESRVRLDGLRLRMEQYPRRRTETSLALARELRIEGHESEARSLLANLRGRPSVDIEIARWAIEAGEYPQALELLMPIASGRANPRPVRARAWSMAAIARDLDGDGEGAISAAGEALKLDPKSSAPYITLAGLAQSRGDFDGALEHLRRAWGMDPADTRLLTRIASVAEQAGRQEEALLALERAVEIDPGSPELAVRLISLQLRAGRYAEAAVALSEALDRHPTDPGLLSLADRLPREIGIR